jgi:serine/threonine protein kinase
MVDRSPTEIGKYRIECELGRGGMGVVYRAFDRVVERPVAIKTIGFGDIPSAQLLDRLKREARAIGQLEHPNIVSLYDAGETEGLYYLVMQFVEGETLRQRIERKPGFTPQEILEIFSQLLGALAYSHSRGVIHRDIKPANVMITPEGVVKLTDFGIAKLADAGISVSGMVAGTPSYMSPEQIMGQSVDARSDIFAVGCLLYELVTGAKAFSGGNTTAITYKILHEPPPLPSAIIPGIHPGFQSLILTALAKHPTERFGSCRQFESALQSCMGEPDRAFEHGIRTAAASQALSRRKRKISSIVLPAATMGALLLSVLMPAPTPARPPRLGPPLRVVYPAPAPAVTDDVVVEKPSPTPEPSARQIAPHRKAPPRKAPFEELRQSFADPEPLVRESSSSQDTHIPEPESFASIVVSGDQSYQQNRYSEALSHYLDGLRLRPHDPSVRRKLVLVLTLLGRTEEAQAYRN